MPSWSVSPAGPPPRLLRQQPGVVGGVQRLLKRGHVVARVVHRAERGLVRLGELRQQVLAAHLRRVDPGRVGEQVHRPVDRGGGLGAAGPPVGADRRGVGRHRAGPRLGPRDVVRAGRHQDRQHRQERARLRVGAAVLDDLDPVGEDGAVPPAADGDPLFLGAAVGHRQHVLHARLRPARRAAQLPRDPADDPLLGVDAELGAERAADVRGDDPHLVGLEAEHRHQRALGALRALVRDPGGQPPVLAPDGGGGPALHRRGRDPLVLDDGGGDDLAALEEAGVARGRVAEGADDVRPRLGEEQAALAAQRLVHGDDGGQDVVIDVHQLDGVLALVHLLGHDRRDRLADEPHHAAGEQRLLHGLVHVRHHRGKGAEPRVRQVAGRVDGEYAGRLERGADVDAVDRRVRDGGADEVHVTGARQPFVLDVFCVDGSGAQEARVFGPQDPGAEYAHAVNLM